MEKLNVNLYTYNYENPGDYTWKDDTCAYYQTDQVGECVNSDRINLVGGEPKCELGWKPEPTLLNKGHACKTCSVQPQEDGKCVCPDGQVFEDDGSSCKLDKPNTTRVCQDHGQLGWQIKIQPDPGNSICNFCEYNEYFLGSGDGLNAVSSCHKCPYGKVTQRALSWNDWVGDGDGGASATQYVTQVVNNKKEVCDQDICAKYMDRQEDVERYPPYQYSDSHWSTSANEQTSELMRTDVLSSMTTSRLCIQVGTAACEGANRMKDGKDACVCSPGYDEGSDQRSWETWGQCIPQCNIPQPLLTSFYRDQSLTVTEKRTGRMAVGEGSSALNVGRFNPVCAPGRGIKFDELRCSDHGVLTGTNFANGEEVMIQEAGAVGVGWGGLCEKCQIGHQFNGDKNTCDECAAGMGTHAWSGQERMVEFHPDHPDGKCETCPINTHEVNGVCEKCRRGTYAGEGASECTTCPGASACYPLPPGNGECTDGDSPVPGVKTDQGGVVCAPPASSVAKEVAPTDRSTELRGKCPLNHRCFTVNANESCSNGDADGDADGYAVKILDGSGLVDPLWANSPYQHKLCTTYPSCGLRWRSGGSMYDLGAEECASVDDLIGEKVTHCNRSFAKALAGDPYKALFTKCQWTAQSGDVGCLPERDTIGYYQKFCGDPDLYIT